MTGGLGPALTLGQMLDQAAARDPSQEAVVFKGERVSYGLLKARADAFARTPVHRPEMIEQQEWIDLH